MISVEIGEFKAELFDEIYSSDSADNINKFDFEYLDIDGSYAEQVGIKLYKDDAIFKSAIISAFGGGTTVHKTSFVTEADRIIICCADTVFCLSIPDLSLLWKTKADTATCFEIFKLPTDYIVHGELDITRLGHDGRILWQQSGGDIFTTLHSTNDDFIITDDYILATDWENRKYKFDFDGNIIS